MDVKDRTRVVGESGKSYPLKYVKPVPVDSTEAVPQARGGLLNTQTERGGSCVIMPIGFVTASEDKHLRCTLWRDI